MIFKEILAVCSENHVKHITHCGQNAEFSIVKTRFTYNYHRASSTNYLVMFILFFQIYRPTVLLCSAAENLSLCISVWYLKLLSVIISLL
jgi:hypothetical protein